MKSLPKPEESRLAHRNGGDDLFKPPQIEGLVMLPLSLIDPNPDDERRRLVPRKEETMAASIRVGGVIEPIAVIQIGKRYQTIRGHRRVRGAITADLKTIPAIILNASRDRIELELDAIVGNDEREPTHLVDKAVKYRKILKTGVYRSAEALAHRLTKTKEWMSELLSILDLPPCLLEKVRTSEHNIPLDALSKISRVKDSEFQSDLVDAAAAKATVKQIRRWIKDGKIVRVIEPDEDQDSRATIAQAKAPENQPAKTDGMVRAEKIDALFVAKAMKRIRSKVQERFDTPPPPLPKRLFIAGKVRVSIKSLNDEPLSPARCLTALNEALRQAREK